LFCYLFIGKSSQLKIRECNPSERQPKPDWSKLVFGHTFTDHMFEVNWTLDKGWGTPIICPIHNFSLHPSAKVFHYAQEVTIFEFKAYDY
jgi:branched-chain amino acid aminotransferase